MKFQISIFFLLIFNHSIGQNRVFFGQSDSCKTFFKKVQQDSTLLLNIVNRCENYSAIEQVVIIKGMYSRNGVYTEFYDTTFTKLKKTGLFRSGIETGMWREYYSSGQLKCEGTCKIVKLIESALDANTILRIDVENPKDTSKISYSSTVIDSLNSLAQYNYYPPYERRGLILPNYYSLKVGTWYYYSEFGNLLKTEVYQDGTLKKSE